MQVSRRVMADVSSGESPEPGETPSIDRPRSEVLPPGTLASIHSRIVIWSNAFAAGPPSPHRYGPTSFESRTSRRLSRNVRDLVAVPQLTVEDQQARDVTLFLVCGPQVVQMQAERGDEPPELHMPSVDELSPVFGHLPVSNGCRGPATTSTRSRDSSRSARSRAAAACTRMRHPRAPHPPRRHAHHALPREAGAPARRAAAWRPWQRPPMHRHPSAPGGG